MAGIYKYGFGNWKAIRGDPDLGLMDKLSIDEGDAAQRTALTAKVVRRAEYLLKVVREIEDEEEERVNINYFYNNFIKLNINSLFSLYS